MAHTIISANCHIIEPATMFEGRMPERFAAAAPRIVDHPGGGVQWTFDGMARPLLSSCAVVGIPREDWVRTVLRYEDMRPGCYDARARLADMDVDGVYATASYSSPASMGFAGDLFSCTKDPELGIAAMRAWNDWYAEEWVATDPARFIPIGYTWYRDPHVAADEVRRNAARGFKGVSFRNPTDMEEPWVGSGHWDPLFAACEETGTVLVLHTMNVPWWPRAPEGSQTHLLYPYGLLSTMFQSSAMEVLAIWLWGGVVTRFPKLRILMSESGGSWLPHIIDRLNWSIHYSPLHRAGWPTEMEPIDLIRRNFVFSTLEVDSARMVEERYGITGWMLEADYPHMESVWPETQSHYARQLDGLPDDVVRGLTWENASALFRHPVPTELQRP
ncbi:MAG: amidohydrolase family protein [Sphingobium sp.]